MRLLQINIWQGRLIKNFYKLIERLNPDIITFQELCSSGDSESGLFNNLEEFQAKFNYNYVYEAPTNSFKFSDFKIKSGNYILSKLSFANSATIFTNLSYKENFNYKNDDYNIRNFAHVELNINGKATHVITHHGHHLGSNKDGNIETLRQMEILVEYINNLTGPIILTGDFNLSPHSKSIELLNSKLINLCLTNNITTTRNEFATVAVQVCDYIFVSKDITVQKFSVVPEIVSDHQALLLDFDLKTN